MNLLADVNVEWVVVRTLRADGHDVRWLAEGIIERGLKDSPVMEIAHREGRVILTSDREFVNYVFRDRLFTYGVVLLRVALDFPRMQSSLASCHFMDAGFFPASAMKRTYIIP